jgi:hypothetical protein
MYTFQFLSFFDTTVIFIRLILSGPYRTVDLHFINLLPALRGSSTSAPEVDFQSYRGGRIES